MENGGARRSSTSCPCPAFSFAELTASAADQGVREYIEVCDLGEAAKSGVSSTELPVYGKSSEVPRVRVNEDEM